MVERFKGWNGGMVEWWNGLKGGTVEWLKGWNGGTGNGGMVERWNGGMVERVNGWNGLMVIKSERLFGRTPFDSGVGSWDLGIGLFAIRFSLKTKD